MTACSMSDGCKRRDAYTLVELLVVLAIILIIAGVGIGGLGNWKARGVTTAGTAIFENLALARELAISHNQPTELWFLQRKTGGTFVDGLQIRLVSTTGDTTGYDKVVRMPVNVGIDTGPLSKLITNSNNAKTWPSGSGLSQPAISDYGSDYNCWCVRFMPDGSTTLSNDEQYCTAHETIYGNNLAALPKNYVLLSVAPQTGKITLYRP